MAKWVRDAWRVAAGILALGVLTYLFHTWKSHALHSADAKLRPPAQAEPARSIIPAAPAVWSLKGHVVDEEDEIVPLVTDARGGATLRAGRNIFMVMELVPNALNSTE